jgi:hypothetical protein
LLILQLHIQIGDETGIRSSNVSPKDRMTLHTKQTLSWVFFVITCLRVGKGGGRFPWENTKKRMERHKDIVRKRRIVMGSQNHRERERERER